MMKNAPITKSALWLVVSLSAGSVWSQAASGRLAPEPDGGPVVILKVPVADCRVVRGCFGPPIDGSVHSWDYRGTVREHPKTVSDGVGYAYSNNDGVHLTLANGDGFVVVDVPRGVAVGRLQPQPGRLGSDATMGGYLAGVPSAGQLSLHTDKHLWCIGEWR